MPRRPAADGASREGAGCGMAAIVVPLGLPDDIRGPPYARSPVTVAP